MSGGPAELERTLLSESAEQTRTLGHALGRLLQPGDFVGLVGDLGAGKTELVRGIAEGAGVSPEEVTSPSFALVNLYAGRLRLCHADLYRLADADELYAMGWEDLLEGDCAFVVEWLDQVPRAAPRGLLRVELSVEGECLRQLRAQAWGTRATALLQAWLAG